MGKRGGEVQKKVTKTGKKLFLVLTIRKVDGWECTLLYVFVFGKMWYFIKTFFVIN